MKYFKKLMAVLFLFVVPLFIENGLSYSFAQADEDLQKQAKQLFGSLPEVISSETNPITPEKVSLGKMLFYETRISIDGTVSCARCHPISLYAADGLRKSIGNNCKVNPRNAPTIFNAAGQISEHWIGNRQDVEDQAKQSVMGPPSFGMSSYEAVENKLKEIKGYAPLFAKAFPAEKNPIKVDNFAKAVGAFERTLVTPSRFDAFVKGDKTALTDSQKKGLKTFIETGCMTCHSSAYIGGQMYQKFGVFEPYWQYTKSKEIDEGRYVVTKNEADKYVFKVPVLRNVEKTAPYFHDGSVDRLEKAVWIMGKVQLGKDLAKPQLEEIVAFLQSVTGVIPEDALTIPLIPSME
ncbi:MAG TPA: cytochrome-c peroxidase [Candidatus Wunengus sp. YC65]|uniref:cytochrome-c peroxidase n=1 Tax=Candidatus Wunengus sp. YC65 TaxID=3367701 RepID=UPI0040293DBC